MRATASQPQPPVLTLREAAHYLRLSERTLWDLARRDEVPSFKLGKQYRFSLSSLEKLAGERSGGM